MSTVKKGVVALRMAASPEATSCWPQTIRREGDGIVEQPHDEEVAPDLTEYAAAASASPGDKPQRQRSEPDAQKDDSEGRQFLKRNGIEEE